MSSGFSAKPCGSSGPGQRSNYSSTLQVWQAAASKFARGITSLSIRDPSGYFLWKTPASNFSKNEVLASLPCLQLCELDVNHIPMFLGPDGPDPANPHVPSVLESLQGLTRLWLDTRILGDLQGQLGHLTTLPNLQDLFIKHRQLDFPTDFFPAMTQLTRLRLSAEEPPQQAIRQLGCLAHLKALELELTPDREKVTFSPHGRGFLLQVPEDTTGLAAANPH